MTSAPTRFRDRARPRNGPFATLNPWTDQDDAALRASFGPGGLAAARQALPARTPGALLQRARRLGLSRRPRWTPAQDDQLRALWTGEFDLQAIATRLGRSPATIYARLQHLRLPLGCPPGWESLTRACERTGYDFSQLRRILAADGATIRNAITRKDARGRQGGDRRRWQIVSISEVDAAVAAWVEEEPVAAAARRIGMAWPVLVRRLRALGLRRPRKARLHWRVTAEQVEAAAAIPLQRGRPMRAVAQAGGRLG
jgi:hypothetical protein